MRRRRTLVPQGEIVEGVPSEVEQGISSNDALGQPVGSRDITAGTVVEADNDEDQDYAAALQSAAASAFGNAVMAAEGESATTRVGLTPDTEPELIPAEEVRTTQAEISELRSQMGLLLRQNQELRQQVESRASSSRSIGAGSASGRGTGLTGLGNPNLERMNEDDVEDQGAQSFRALGNVGHEPGFAGIFGELRREATMGAVSTESHDLLALGEGPISDNVDQRRTQAVFVQGMGWMYPLAPEPVRVGEDNVKINRDPQSNVPAIGVLQPAGNPQVGVPEVGPRKRINRGVPG